MTPFDFTKDNNAAGKSAGGKKYDRVKTELDIDTISKLKKYKIEDYVKDVETLGLESTWNDICQFVVNGNDEIPSLLSTDYFAELYEIGLAIQDKVSKKKNGQYSTPDDVALVMSKWLERCEGDAVCDVGCGTGKLILTYLDFIGEKRARDLILSGKLYLYDVDPISLKICWTAIAMKYGLDIADAIHDVLCDFLDPNVKLPENCKVIANPPYTHLDEILPYWDHTDVLMDARESYAAFMEKIFRQSESAVIITPFSFISGRKFYSLRKCMCEIGNGFIVAFDNIPGNIFRGKKHGIFNTNTANSVRAAITVMNRDPDRKGFRVTPLIRFKNGQRSELLKTAVLENMLPPDYQVIDETNDSFRKIEKDLIGIYEDWVSKSEYTLKDFISEKETAFFIDMPNTCRYYTTASARKLSRNGSIPFFVKEEDPFNFIYCLINSSFAYWWWRIFDGGITYPVGLLNNMPVPMNLLSEEDLKFFKEMREKMEREESKHIVTKKNAGVVQENIKFPEEYRIVINERILKILGHSLKGTIFESVHANFLKLKNKCDLFQSKSGDKMSLTESQRKMMSEFYRVGATKVIYNKKERDKLWGKTKAKSPDLDWGKIKKKCPALHHQIEKSYESGNNIQSAVFSECVYAQTLANMMGLSRFADGVRGISPAVQKLLFDRNLTPRYIYSTEDGTCLLVQAGGCNGVDCALITLADLKIYTIEFKEQGAKTSEPDLPKYGEDGFLIVPESWLKKNSQFTAMLEEQKGLNFFKVMGKNIHNFSAESIDIAVSNNYSNERKQADVICTEDAEGYLVMLPANQVSRWAETEGEIRPAGRNSYDVWTPIALRKFLKEKGATINDDMVTIKRKKLEAIKQRGGTEISRYRVNPLFFVRVDCKENDDGVLTFPFSKMRQLKPTIAGKMSFKKLKHGKVKDYYGL